MNDMLSENCCELSSNTSENHSDFSSESSYNEMEDYDIIARSLFDDFSSTSIENVWEHMKTKHGFDLNEFHTVIPEFDDYKRLRLLNFLRKLQSSKKEPVSVKTLLQHQELWDSDIYEALDDPSDPLFYCLPIDYVEDSEEETCVDPQYSKHSRTENAESQTTERKDLCNDSEQDASKSADSKNLDTVDLQKSIQESPAPYNNDLSKMSEVDKNYFDSYASLDIHRVMILDQERTGAYYDYIMNQAKNILQDKVVLDIGCGTGILSFMCARAGAKLVVGIDAASHIIRYAKCIRDLNGFTPQNVQFINCKSEDTDILMRLAEDTSIQIIQVPKGSQQPLGYELLKVDIIVSEWMGYALLYEAMLQTVLDARNRYLSKDGHILPRYSAMEIQGADFSDEISSNFSSWSSLYGFDLSPLRPNKNEFFVEPQVDKVDVKRLLTQPCTFLTLDLEAMTMDRSWPHMPFQLKFLGSKKATLTSYVISFFCKFSDDQNSVCLRTSPTSPVTHWKQTILHCKPEYHTSMDQPCQVDGHISLGLGTNSRGLSFIIEAIQNKLPMIAYHELK